MQYSIPISVFQNLRIEPVFYYRAVVSEAMRDMQVNNPFASFWALETGGVALEWAGGTTRLGPGACVLVPPGLRRRHQFAPQTRIVSVSFKAHWGQGKSLILLREPLIARGKTAKTLSKAGRKLCRGGPERTLRQWLSFSSDLSKFVAGILDWIDQAGGACSMPGEGDPRLEKILRELSGSVSAGPLPYARWCGELGLSRVQIDRLARKWTGRTLRSIRDTALLEAIRTALLVGGESQKELAARLGFHDAAHFSHWITRATGAPTSALRRTVV